MALSCGATLGDVPARQFDSDSGMGVGLELMIGFLTAKLIMVKYLK